jgi:hypothetical protein
MKPGTVVELAGLATLALVAVVIWMDGVPNEVVGILPPPGPWKSFWSSGRVSEAWSRKSGFRFQR